MMPVQELSRTQEYVAPAISTPKTAVELQEQYFAAVYAFVSRRIRPREDAEDVTCETFAAAFRDLHKVRGDARLWLFGIARRKIVDLLRRRNRAGNTVEHTIQEDAQLSLEKDEAVAQLRTLIDQLPQDQRDALLLQHLEGLSVAEIAVVMKRSRKSVKGLLARARENLYRSGRGYFADEV